MEGIEITIKINNGRGDILSDMLKERAGMGMCGRPRIGRRRMIGGADNLSTVEKNGIEIIGVNPK